MPLMQQRHFEYLADKVAPLLPWPSAIIEMADRLADTNPKFNKDKFISRATTAWEEAHPIGEMNDDIPY
tara:strand:+ start:2853 stop:3059 length:207 start_codon:yes stop_codon:yes gene_type:complete